MSARVSKATKALLLIAAGTSVAAGGIYLSEADDAPGAALVGILLLIGALAVAVKVLAGMDR